MLVSGRRLVSTAWVPESRQSVTIRCGSVVAMAGMATIGAVRCCTVYSRHTAASVAATTAAVVLGAD
jgi:multisubunit Na+/H+ antiporter MnhG subunit